MNIIHNTFKNWMKTVTMKTHQFFWVRFLKNIQFVLVFQSLFQLVLVDQMQKMETKCWLFIAFSWNISKFLAFCFVTFSSETFCHVFYRFSLLLTTNKMLKCFATFFGAYGTVTMIIVTGITVSWDQNNWLCGND